MEHYDSIREYCNSFQFKLKLVTISQDMIFSGIVLSMETHNGLRAQVMPVALTTRMIMWIPIGCHALRRLYLHADY
jgi:hypothetical protein